MFDKMLGGFSMSILTAASSKSAWHGYEYYMEDKVQFVKNSMTLTLVVQLQVMKHSHML